MEREETYSVIDDEIILSRFHAYHDKLTYFARLTIGLYLLRNRGHVTIRELAEFLYGDKEDFQRYYRMLYNSFKTYKTDGRFDVEDNKIKLANNYRAKECIAYLLRKYLNLDVNIKNIDIDIIPKRLSKEVENER